MIPAQNVFSSSCNQLQQFLPSYALTPNDIFQSQTSNFPLTLPSVYVVPNPALLQALASYDVDSLSRRIYQDIQAQLSNIFSAFAPKLEPSSPVLSSNSQLDPTYESSDYQIKTEESTSEVPIGLEIYLEAQVKAMIQFFIKNCGILNNKDMQKARLQYEDDSRLLEAFDALKSKYLTTTKTREEMIKWILRRTFNFRKQSMKKGQKKDHKKILVEICSRYFKDLKPKCEENGGDMIQDWVDWVLPFRKNSKNKTMNTNFVIEIFQSAEFKQDYQEFLKGFDEVIEKENIDKIHKFAKVIVDCIKKDDFDRIAKYRRLPWLCLWKQNTKKVAFELENGDFEGKSSKKIKL